MKAIKHQLAVVAMAGLAAGLLGYGAVSRAGQGAQGAATAPAERHPEIRKALAGLREAKTALENADHDFEGHRVAALKDTEDAIKECEDALKVDAK